MHFRSINNNKWYVKIQDAIDDASSGDEIVVYPGKYYETLRLKRYGFTYNIHSIDPNNWDIVEATEINNLGAANTVSFNTTSGNFSGFSIVGGNCGFSGGPGNYTVNRCMIEDNNSGFQVAACKINLTNSIVRHNKKYGIKIGSSGSINNSNNLICDNNEGIYFEDHTSGNLHNNTIVNNSSHGIYCSPTCSPCNVKNSILWNNGDDLYGDVNATFCCIRDNDSGNGNIHDDPCFIDNDFFHIDMHSPCVNVGDGFYNENDIDGDRRVINGSIDMGADEVNDVKVKAFNPNPSNGQTNVTLEPIENARVIIGSESTYTNSSGYYEINN